MARIEESQIVNAPTGVVFEYADKHENYPRLLPMVTDLEWSTPRHEVGTLLRMKMKSAGITTLVEYKTTEVVPDARVAGIFTSGVTGNWEWNFEPAGEATRMTYKVDYDLPMGLLGQFADKAMVERDMREGIETIFRIIKEDLETGRSTA